MRFRKTVAARRFVAVLLVIMLTGTMIPTFAFAEGEETSAAQEGVQSATEAGATQPSSGEPVSANTSTGGIEGTGTSPDEPLPSEESSEPPAASPALAPLLPAGTEEANTEEDGTGSISGVLWLDVNGNGLKDAEETPVANYPVSLYLSTDVETPLQTITTKEDGSYLFESLGQVSYKVGIRAKELSEEQYLLPLVGSDSTYDNRFELKEDEENPTDRALTNDIALAKGSAVEDIDAGLREAVTPGLLDAPAPDEGAAANLTVNVGSNGEGWQNVDSIVNAITWPLTQKTKQIQVIAEFPVSTSQSRIVTIDIPHGYQILEMSGKKTWEVPSGITRFNLSDEDESKIYRMSLTAAVGTEYAAQALSMGAIPPENRYYSPHASSQRLYGGRVTYEFNDNCDHIVLTLTLGLRQEVVGRAATVELPNIEVALTYGQSTTNTYLTTTMSEIVLPSTGSSQQNSIYGGSRNVAGEVTADPVDPFDPTKESGSLEEFKTGFNYSDYHYTLGEQPHWAESASFVLTYPEGVTLTGFAEKPILAHTATLLDANKIPVTAFTASGDSEGSETWEATGNAASHLTVTHNPTQRTVTFSYNNTRFVHDGNSGSFWLYWTADINQNGSPLQWDQRLSFVATWTESGGAFAGSSHNYTRENNTVIITARKSTGINISASGTNRVRQDWNAYAQGGFLYDQALGQFRIFNEAPNDLTTPLRYVYTFDDSLAVRGLALPGYLNNNYSNLVVTTSSGTVIEKPGPFNVVNVGPTGCGYIIDSAYLGLAKSEFIREFQIDQAGLRSGNLAQSYLHSSTTYYGRWQGEDYEGEAKVEIYDMSMPDGDGGYVLHTSATDRPRNGWTNAAAGTTTLTLKDRNGVTPAGGSFNPTDQITFTARLTSAPVMQTSNHLVDPTVYIALPAGIDLDQTTVQAKSLSGNEDDWFNLRLLDPGTYRNEYTDALDVVWKVYAYTSNERLDMVAREPQSGTGASSSLAPAGYNYIDLRFSATVSSTCATYTDLRAQDFVMWDLGKTAVNSTSGASFVVSDSRDLTGNGTSYNVVAPVQSLSLNIVQKPGLKVSLGLRVWDPANTPSSPAFGTYNGTPASIAPVSVDRDAELWVSYENTSATAYDVGSEIYLPIPKEGNAYDHFFNNAEYADPVANAEDTRTPQWTAYLTGPVRLDGFDTYYTTSTNYTTMGGTVDNTWVPISNEAWSLKVPNDDYSAVTMIKFVANERIVSGGSGSTVFRFAVDEDARLGQVNYWRTYQKGWRLGEGGAGTWQYGAVVAAEPSKAGVTAMLFLDVDTLNGAKDNDTTERFANATPATGITAVLTEAGGGIPALSLSMNADGSFKTLHDNGTQYFLKTGVYTATITNNSGGAYFFTSITPNTRSSATAWNMDVPQLSIVTDPITGRHTQASYTFTVDERSTTSTEYLGVGLVPAAYTLTYHLNTSDTTASFGSDSITSEAGLAYGTVVGNTDSYAANTTGEGIPTRTNYVFDGWYTDRNGENPASTATITANTTVYAKWLPAYRIEHYQVDAHGTATLVVADTVVRSAEDNTVVSVDLATDEKSYPGYTYKPGYENGEDKEVLSGTVTANSALALRLYYQINLHDITYSYTNTAPSGVRDAADFNVENAAYATTQTVNSTYTSTSTVGGYTFSGWTPAPTLTIAANGTFTMPDSDVAFTGSWEPSPYTLAFNENAADAVKGTPSKTVYYNQQVGTLPSLGAGAPTRAGYTFEGWSTNAGEANTANFTADEVWTTAGDGMVYAVWTANDYTITYQPNGGEGESFNQSVTYGATYTTAAADVFTRTGYTFAGWSRASDGLGFVAGSEYTYAVAGNTTLNALWTPNTGTPYRVEHYLVSAFGTVTLDATENLGGTTGTQVNATVRYYASHTYAPSYPGTVASGTVAGDGSLVLRLYYTQNTYTVTFVDWNGLVLATRAGIPYGGAALAPLDPVRAGYTFTGWDRPFNNITSNLTVTALYTPLPAIPTYTVTFVDFDGTVLATRAGIPYGGAAAAPANPTREDFTFTGWDRAFGYITSNLTVTALYEPLPVEPTFTVTYVAGGANVTGLPANGTYEEGDTVTVGAAPSRTGSTFTGWSSSLGGTVQPGDTFTMPAADVTLTATWEALPTTPSTVTPIPPDPAEPVDITDNPLFTIPGTNVPLFGEQGGHWSLFDLLCMILGALACVVALVRAFTRKKFVDEPTGYDRGYTRTQGMWIDRDGNIVDESDEGERHTRKVLLIISAVVAVVGVVLFILTQDLTLPMALFDWWSLIFALLFVAALLTAIFAFKRARIADDEEEPQAQSA